MSLIINFHKVNDPLWLENVLKYLKRRFENSPLSEIINPANGHNEAGKACHITVDDGDRSFYEVIFPALKKYSLQATIFVSPESALNRKNFWFQEIEGYEASLLQKIVSQVIGANEKEVSQYPITDIFKCLTLDVIWEIIDRYRNVYGVEKKPCQNMTVDEIKEVERSGLITVGAHTIHHPILANETAEVTKNEIAMSLAGLSDILGHEVMFFAYPNGIPGLDFGCREIEVLKESGCQAAFTTVHGRFNSQTDLLAIPRIGITSGESPSYINAKLFAGSYWNYVKRIKPGNEYVNRKSFSRLVLVKN